MAAFANVTSPRELMALFKQYGLSPRRPLGQNFLIDANIVEKITAAVEAKEKDAIIEVGPGAGALTLNLAKTGAELIILEIDRGLVRLLTDLLKPWPRVKIIEGDALNADWNALAGSFIADSAAKLVSNLPYNISGPFMYGLFKAGFPFKSAVLMFQKEVARRLVARPGDSEYGGLSVICSYYTDGKMLFNVSKNVFWPRPKVDSAVIRLKPRKRILTYDEEKIFWKVVQIAFQQRRKTLLNSLTGFLSGSREGAAGIFTEAAIDPGARPEQLTMQQFAKLALITYNYHSKLS